jgi:GxxExxY protein
MHPLYERACSLTGKIIGAAIEVHRHFGPGLVESVYEWALIHELGLAGLSCQSQQLVRIEYKGAVREEPLRYDVLVEGAVPVEVKGVEAILPIHKAQVVSYLKLLNVPLGMLINFHEHKLVDGVSRLFFPGLEDRALKDASVDNSL